MRVLKQLLDRGDLGEPVIATIEMRAIPHWQDFLRDYDRLTLLNMSIHHLDVLRFLFGDPTEIFTAARTDPRTAFAHTDGITASTLQFPSGLLAVSLEDVWSGRARSRASSPTSTSSGGSRGRRAWRKARSAGPTTRPAARRPCATARSARPAAHGSSRAGRRCGSRTPSRA